MADIKIFTSEFSTDFALAANGALEGDSSLESAVIISLFTDARAAQGDELPGNAAGRRGWFGNVFLPGNGIGSKLWLISRGKLTPQTLLKAQTYALEALQWLIDDGAAGSVQVTAGSERLPSQTYVLTLSVVITRGSVVLLNQRYGYAWEGV